MPKPALGVDVDGTLAATHSRWLELAREKHGVDARLEDLKIYEFWKLVGPATRRDALRLFKDAWDDYTQIKLENKDIPEVIERLSKAYRIKIITACVGRERDVKAWLKDNNIRYDSFYRTPNKSDKLRVKTHIHLEDCGEVAEMFAKHGRNVVLLSQPWNSDTRAGVRKYGTARIAKDWRDIERYVTSNGF